MSHSWKSPAGDDWTIPVGGGVRRLFKIRDQKMGLQFQAFDYIATKKTDPEWELRFTIEYIFDERVFQNRQLHCVSREAYAVDPTAELLAVISNALSFFKKRSINNANLGGMSQIGD